MIDISKYARKELLVRKKVASLIEKVIRFFGNDIRHDIFKGVVYGEIGAATKSEEILKNYYDAYVYLLSNCKMVLSNDLLKRFFYILRGEIADDSLLTRIASSVFHSMNEPLIKRLIDMPIYIYDELTNCEECERTLVALMFFNYYLVRDGIPTIPFLRADMQKYVELRNLKDTEGLEKFIVEKIENGKFQDKEYSKSLKDIDIVDIQRVILNEKEVLVNNYGIQHAYIYGSFAKGTQRIDSDIDIIFIFPGNFTYYDKADIINRLSQHYFNVFNRYIDIHEAGAYVNDSLIKEISKYTKIF